MRKKRGGRDREGQRRLPAVRWKPWAAERAASVCGTRWRGLAESCYALGLVCRLERLGPSLGSSTWCADWSLVLAVGEEG